MKRWISVCSHGLAAFGSFVTLSVAPVVLYGTVALARGWQHSEFGDASSLVTVPLLSAIGAGAFSVVAAPLLAMVAQKLTRRFGWNALMFPLLLSCAGTVALSLASGLFGLHLSSLTMMGGGLGLGAAFSSYWLPLRWAQRVLPRLDAKGARFRGRLEAGGAPRPISLS